MNPHCVLGTATLELVTSGIARVCVLTSGDVGSPGPTPAPEAEGHVVWTCLRTSDGTAVSLISSLIHVRIPGSITVRCRALSRLNRPAWPVVDGLPSS